MNQLIPAHRFLITLAVILGLVGHPVSSAAADPKPLERAHAHNDYEHTRPLFDALDQGFCSVEADVHLVNGRLLVAHDLKDAKPDRTLESLYLDPLRERARRNGGRIYPGGPVVILLVDVKSDAVATYTVLDRILRQYDDLVTRHDPTGTVVKAVEVIISGNRDYKTLARQKVRYAALDGRLGDLKKTYPKDLIPLVSEDWKSHFKWQGGGPLPADEEMKLQRIIGETHKQGRRFRFWGTPDRAEFWETLSKAGVDLLNADDLPALRRFLTRTEGK
jgi:hypothetical protein